MPQIISGFRCETPQNFLLDSGAVFKNFNIATDTVTSAIEAGKLFGATRGGSTFTATPEIRYRAVDGMRGTPKGGIAIDSWTVTLLANFIEVTAETLKAALGAADVKLIGDKYMSIMGRNLTQDSDYYDNVTWVGTLNGSDDPVAIQILNAMSTSGISMNFADKNEAVLPVTFAATYDTCGGTMDLNYAPFAIFYPKTIPAPVVNPVTSSDTIIYGTGLAGAVVAVSGGTLPAGLFATVNSGGIWIIPTIPAQSVGVTISAIQTLNGKSSLPASIVVIEDEEDEG